MSLSETIENVILIGAVVPNVASATAGIVLPGGGSALTRVTPTIALGPVLLPPQAVSRMIADDVRNRFMPHLWAACAFVYG